MDISLKPIGYIHSVLKNRGDAPKQGDEDAPDAWIEVEKEYILGLKGLTVGTEIILITWLHQSDRNILVVHPRNNENNPLTGVFATRSPVRPNPLGLHQVIIKELSNNSLKVGLLEAIDGTPVIDIKIALKLR